MSCRVVTRDPNEISRIMMNKGILFPKLSNQTAEETWERITYLQNLLKKKDETYLLNEVPVKTRVSEKAKRGAGRPETSITPDNTIQREAGTKAHEVLSKIIEHLYNNNGTLAAAEAFAKQGPYSISTKSFGMLVAEAKDILNLINQTQAKIDNTKKAKVKTEMFEVDSRSNTGGSMDVFALYSDNTGSIFDFKTKSGINKVQYKGSEVIIQDELFSGLDLLTYDLSQSEYSRIAREALGVKRIRHNRLVPILLRFDLKPEAEREEGSRLQPVIKDLFAGAEVSQYLNQIPVGGEESDYTGLNKLLDKQIKHRDSLNKKLRAGKLSVDEKNNLKTRITNLNRSIKKTLIDADIADLLMTVKGLINEFTIKVNQEPLLENGEPNPAYMEIDALRLALKELEIYDNIVDETHLYFEDLKKGDPAMFKKLKDDLHYLKLPLEYVTLKIRKELETRTLDKIDNGYKDEKGNMLPVEELDMIQRMTVEFSEINNPYFREAWLKIQNAQFEIRKEITKIYEDIQAKQEELFKWAKSQGLSKQEAFDLMINRKTGNLHGKIKQEFWVNVTKAKENKSDEDYKWLKERFEIRNKEEWHKVYKNRLEALKLQLKAENNGLEALTDSEGKVVNSAEYYEAIYQKKLMFWITNNNLLESKAAWFNKYNSSHLELKDKYKEENYTPEYKKIKSSKPLSDFYDMWTENMKNAQRLLGIYDYNKLPSTFIPNIRKELVEYLTDNDTQLAGAVREFKDSFNVREEDVYIGSYDENGELQKNIPILFINPLRRKDKTIDNNLKTYDLGESLINFMGMAYNYHHMNSIEGELLSLKDLMGRPTAVQGGIETTDKMGNRLKGKMTAFITSKTGITTDTYQLFDKFLNKYLYGIRFEEKSLSKKFDTTQAILNLKNYRSRTALAFAVIPAAGALIAGRTALHFEGKKGISFTSEMETKAEKLLFTNADKYIGLTEFFHAYSEGAVERMASELSVSKLKRASKDRTLFYFLRKVDEKLMDRVLVSMAQNYAVAKDGTVVRLTRKGVDNSALKNRTILELARYDKENDKWTVPGLSKEGHIQFRNAVKKTMAGIIGNMSSEDIAGFDLTLVGSLMAQFRTWMPGIVREHTGKLRWDDDIQAMRWGRFAAYLGEYKRSPAEIEAGLQIGSFISKVVVPNLAKLSLDLITFGIAPKMGLKRVNQERAERRFELFLIEHPEYIGKVTFEDFLEVKEAQIKALVVQLRTILAMLGLIAFLGAKGDDDEPRYYQNWLTRNLYKILTKSSSEMSFMWNPTEFINIIQNPIPLTSLATLTMKTLNNTFDETRDLVFGEESTRDLTPAGYYTMQWAYGGVQIARFLELYEQYKRSPY